MHFARKSWVVHSEVLSKIYFSNDVTKTTRRIGQAMSTTVQPACYTISKHAPPKPIFTLPQKQKSKRKSLVCVIPPHRHHNTYIIQAELRHADGSRELMIRCQLPIDSGHRDAFLPACHHHDKTRADLTRRPRHAGRQAPSRFTQAHPSCWQRREPSFPKRRRVLLII